MEPPELMAEGESFLGSPDDAGMWLDVCEVAKRAGSEKILRIVTNFKFPSNALLEPLPMSPMPGHESLHVQKQKESQ